MPVSTGRSRKPVYRCDIQDTVVYLEDDISQTESLEDLTTMVVDVQLANFPSFVSAGDNFAIRQGGWDSEKEMYQFTGVVDTRVGTSFPNVVHVTGVGPLANTRRAPLNDHDLSGMTDGEAIEYILTQCNVDFDHADIYDFGYPLGPIKPVKWLKGTAGADMIREIDRVIGAATMEIGDGRVCRFLYDKAPSASLISRTFTAGDSQWYYNAERNRGGLNEIQNFWRVVGLTYESTSDGTPAAEDATDTCSATFYAESSAEHPALGSGYVAPQEFQSDIIQTEAMAKRIVIRLMRWYNRAADKLVIETANDPRITPGDVVGLSDPAFGISLSGSPTTHPYLVLSVSRDQDFMRLTCVGGSAGSEGTPESQLVVCCNSQRENGECVDNGSNGAADGPGTIGGPPDVGLGDWTPPDDPPLEDIDIPDPSAPVICDDDATGNFSDPVGADLKVFSPWRISSLGTQKFWANAAGSAVLSEGDVGVYLVDVAGGAVTHSDETDPDLQTTANDTLYGPISWSFCMDVAFCNEGSSASVSMTSTTGANSGAIWYATPGLDVSGAGPHNGQITLEYGQAVTPDGVALRFPSPYSGGGGLRNTGKFFPFGGDSGLAISGAGNPADFVYHSVCVAVDLSAVDQQGYVWGDGGSITAYVEKCLTEGCGLPGEPFDYSTSQCSHSHKLTLNATGGTGIYTCPSAVFKNIGIGTVSCVPNPDYVDPTEQEDDIYTP